MMSSCVPLRPVSSFDEQVKELCAKVIACQTEHQAVELLKELRLLLHERIEELRSRVLPLAENPLGNKVA
jgi:hypothetical protein